MKIKIKNYNGELPSYLTVGKEYEVVYVNEISRTKYILDDDGDELGLKIDDSFHLNGGSWEIVE